MDIDMTAHAALNTIQKNYAKFTPSDNVYMCFDRSPTWRLLYTKTDKAVTDWNYKYKRHADMKPKAKQMFEEFKEFIREFETMLRDFTRIQVLGGDTLEADDIIAGLCNVYKDDEIIIISGDKDFTQLIRPNVKLFDPLTEKFRTLDGEYPKVGFNGDPELFRFSKFIRGDSGDSVRSAYPRIRQTRILKAYTDDFEKNNIMQHTWKNPTNENMEFLTEDLFKEGRLLMSLYLEDMPVKVQKTIITTILDELERKKKFSMFHFIQFCGQHNLKRIKDGVDRFIPLLNNKYQS
jgi:5'-3' exonuclease